MLEAFNLADSQHDVLAFGDSYFLTVNFLLFLKAG